MSVALESGERIAAAALVGADGVYSNVRKRIVGDGEPLPAGAVIFRATIPAAEMPKDLQHPYPTFWAGPGWHMIYYPISDWTMFNLGCTVVTGQSDADESEDVRAATPCCRCFAEGCETPLRVHPHPQALPPLRHRAPRAGRELEHGSGDAARRRRASDGAVHRAGRRHGAGGRDLPRRRGARMRRRFRARVPALSGLRIVRTARVQISSLMMDKLNHAKGVERKVRNSLFEGRTAEEYYDRLAWLYTAPPYVK